MNAIRSVLSIFSSRVGVLVFTIIITPILTRLLGSDGYGDYSFLISTLQWSLTLVYVGSFNGIRKYIAEERETEKWADQVFAFYLKIVVVSATLAITIIFAVTETGFITNLLGEDFVLYFYLIALMIPFRALFRTSRSVLLGFNLEHYSEPLRIIDKAIFAGFVVFLSYVGWGVAAVLAGRTIAIGIVSIVSIALISRRIQLSTIFKSSTDLFPKFDLLKYGLSTMIFSFLIISMYHLDILLLRVIIGDTETGYYKAALVIAEFLWFVPIAIQISLLHSTSKLWAEEQYERLTRVSTQVVRYTLLFTILLVLGTAGLADPLLSLYFGQEFSASVVPLLLLLPGALGFAVARPIFAISQGQDNLRILIIVTAVAALLNLVLNLILIPKYGMNGAAVATSVSYGSMFGLHVWSAMRLGFNPLADIRFKKIIITTLIAAVPIIIVPQYIASDILALLITPPIGLLIFSAVALKLNAVQKQEIFQLLSSSSLPIEKIHQKFLENWEKLNRYI